MKSSSSLRSNDSSLINNASSGGSVLEERLATLCDDKGLLKKEEPRQNSRSLKGTTLENRSHQDSSSNHLQVLSCRGQTEMPSPLQRPEGFIDNVVKVFFKGLKKTTTLETVIGAFSNLNKIKYIRFPFSVVRKKNMGYGFVIFEDQDFALNLIHSIRFVEIDGAIAEFRKESRAEMRNLGRKEKNSEVPSTLKSNQESSPSVLDRVVSRCVGGTSSQSNELQGREKVSATWHRIKPTSASYHKSKRVPKEWHNFSNITLNLSKPVEVSKTSI